MNRSNFLDELIRLEEVLEMNSLRRFELIISILFGHGHENLRGRISGGESQGENLRGRISGGDCLLTTRRSIHWML